MLLPSKIISAHHLEQEAIRINQLFSQKETDGTWKSFDGALLQFKAWLKQGCASMENFIPITRKNLLDPITISILSERSKLSGTGCEVVEELAIQLKSDFDKLSDSLIPPILKLCARTNKIMVQRASKTLNQIILSCSHLRFVHKFVDAMGNQSKTLRVVVTGALKTLLENTHAHSITMELVAEIEKIIRIGLTDAEPTAREHSRASYHLYCEYFPDRVHEFDKSLDATTKKYLSDRSTDAGRWRMNTKSASASPEKQLHLPSSASAHETVDGGISAAALSARLQLERPGRSGPLSLGSKPQRVLISSAAAGGSAKTKDLNGATLMLKPQRIGSADVPKTAPASTVTSPRAHLMTAEGRIGMAARVPAPGTPAPKHLQGRPLRIATAGVAGGQDVKNSASIKLNGESVRVEINPPPAAAEKPSSSKLVESLLAAQSVELEEQQKSESSAAPLLIIDKPEPSIFEEDELHEKTLDKLETTKSHEWSVRVQSYQDLSEILFSVGGAEKQLPETSAAAVADGTVDEELRDKICAAFVQSLSDNHFRVVKIGLDVWNGLLLRDAEDSGASTAKYDETILPLVLQIAEDPQLRAKQEIRTAAANLAEKIQKRMPPVQFMSVLLYTLNAPEFSKNSRVRHGAINLLHQVIAKYKQEFFTKLTVFRMAISRLLGCASDGTATADKLLTRKVRDIIAEIHQVDEKMFFEAVSYFAAADRQLLRQLMVKTIQNYVRHEDHAMNIKRSSTQKPGTDIRKPSTAPVAMTTTKSQQLANGKRPQSSSIPLAKPSGLRSQAATTGKPRTAAAASSVSSSLNSTPVPSQTNTPAKQPQPPQLEAAMVEKAAESLPDRVRRETEKLVGKFVDSLIEEIDEVQQQQPSVSENIVEATTAATQPSPLKDKQQSAAVQESIARACLDDIIVNALNLMAVSKKPLVSGEKQMSAAAERPLLLFESAEQLGEALLRGDGEAIVDSVKANPAFWSGNQAFLLDYLLTAERLCLYKNVLASFEKAFDSAPRKEMVPLMLRYAVNVIINTESVTAKNFAEKLVTVGVRPIACLKQLLAIQDSLDRSMPHFRIYFGFLTPVLCQLLADKEELAVFNFDLKLIDRLMTIVLESLLHTDVAITIAARETMILLSKAMASNLGGFEASLKGKLSSFLPQDALAVRTILNHRFSVEQIPLSL